MASRQDALIVLRTALREPDYSTLFQATEKYRGGAEGQEKTVGLLRALGSLVEDLLLVSAGVPHLVRNIDLGPELGQMAQGVTVDCWTVRRGHWDRRRAECGGICCGRSRLMRWP